METYEGVAKVLRVDIPGPVHRDGWKNDTCSGCKT